VVVSVPRGTVTSFFNNLEKSEMTKVISVPYVLNKNHDGQDVIDEALGELIGEIVCVCYTTTRNEKTGERDNFDTQISVQGHLEGSKKTGRSGRYRIFKYDPVNSSVDTFCYFYNHSVWSIKEDSSTPAIVFIA
jgi:hypothetical protein